MPKKRPEYRRGRPHTDFLTTINNSFSSIDDFEYRIKESVSGHYIVEVVGPEQAERLVEDIVKAGEREAKDLDIRTKIEYI